MNIQRWLKTPFTYSTSDTVYVLNDSNELVLQSTHTTSADKCVFSGRTDEQVVTKSGDVVMLDAQMIVSPTCPIDVNTDLHVEGFDYRVAIIRPAYHARTASIHHKTAYLKRAESDTIWPDL